VIHSLQLGVSRIPQISTIGTEIGLFSDSFVRYKLKEVCFVEDGIQTGPFGSQLHMEDYVDEGTPIITVEHLVDGFISHQNLPLVSDEDKQRLSKYTLKSGDIVLSRVGSVDRSAIVSDNEDGWLFSGRCIRIRPDNSKVNPRYIGWLLQHPSVKEYLRRVAVGLGMPSLNTKIVENLPIYLNPDLGAQQSVVHNCDLLHSLTALKYRIEENLHEMISALFRSWFIDFDPVKIKSDGRMPYGMDEETAALFPDSFVDSELGPIPIGWEVGKLSDIAKITMGTSPPGESYCDLDSGILPLLNGAGDFNDSIIAPKQGTTQPTKIANDGDFVFCIRATIGNLSVCEEMYCIGRGVASAKERNWFDRGFLHQTISNLFRVWEWEATGSVIKGITGPEVKNAPVVLPPKSIRKSFENTVMESMLMIQKCMNLEESLSTCLEALLPRLMSGELSVS